MPSVMEKPSAGSGILSRSRAKTAPNGGQPHSEDDSSEEEHSHGEPGSLGLKAHRPGGGGAPRRGGELPTPGVLLGMVPALPESEPLPCCPQAGTGNLEAGPLAAGEAVLPAPSLPSVPEVLRRPSLSQLRLLIPYHLAGD